MARDSCREEFKLSNFGLEHPKPDLFVTSQWPVPPAVFLLYRFFFATLFVIIIVLSGTLDHDWYTSDSNKVKWFVYFTNWGLLTLTLTVLVQFFLVGYASYRGSSRSTYGEEKIFFAMTWYLKVTWVLHNLTAASSFAITVLYWGLIYNDGVASILLSEDHLHLVHALHTIISVYVVLDLLVSATPVRVYHVFHTMIFAAVYAVFTVVYDVFDGTNPLDLPYIYEVLDWSEDTGGAALYTVLTTFVGLPVLWLVVYAVYTFRIFLHGYIYTGLGDAGGKSARWASDDMLKKERTRASSDSANNGRPFPWLVLQT